MTKKKTIIAVLMACLLAPISSFTLAKNMEQSSWLDSVTSTEKPVALQKVLTQSTPDQLSDAGSCPSENALKALRGVRKVNKGLGYSVVIPAALVCDSLILGFPK